MGIPCIHMFALVPLRNRPVLHAKVHCQKRDMLRGPTWKQPMQSHASFRLRHAKTCGGSDTQDAASQLWGDFDSAQFI